MLAVRNDRLIDSHFFQRPSCQHLASEVNNPNFLLNTLPVHATLQVIPSTIAPNSSFKAFLNPSGLRKPSISRMATAHSRHPFGARQARRTSSPPQSATRWLGSGTGLSSVATGGMTTDRINSSQGVFEDDTQSLLGEPRNGYQVYWASFLRRSRFR
jgi:hypothetical protein